MKSCTTTALIILGLFVLVAGISWLATCGIIYLITLCVGWEFKWLVATAIWLCLMLVSGIFTVNVRK